MSENTIQNYINKIDDLEKEVVSNKDKILKKIKLKELIKNPQEYLKNLAMDFYEANEDILREATELGEKKAKKIIGVYGNLDQKRKI